MDQVQKFGRYTLVIDVCMDSSINDVCHPSLIDSHLDEKQCAENNMTITNIYIYIFHIIPKTDTTYRRLSKLLPYSTSLKQ